MARYFDLTGKKFGRLTVLSYVKRENKSHPFWLCICDCGTEKVIESQPLREGKTVSCGCYSRELWTKYLTKHGNSNHKLYQTWRGMIRRCHHHEDAGYKYYGARGIYVCDSWRQDAKNFFNDMGLPPPRASLDRIDNNKGYSKENCRWATPLMQGSNKRNNNFYTIDGETIHLAEIARKCNIKESTLANRLKKGLSIDDAVKIPVRAVDKTITFNGITKTYVEWAKELNVTRRTIQNRLDSGWSIEDVIMKTSRNKN